MHRAALLIAALLAAGAAQAAPQVRASRPNIVILLADDLGYSDTGLYGSHDIPTPHIDSVARRGALFTSGYVTAAVCSPSRAGLLTGRYQQRFGFEFNAGPVERAFEPEIGLPLGEKTLADVLGRAGYATGIVGKWHLGAHESLLPRRRGFAEFFGFVGGDHRYVDPDQPGISSIRDTRLANSNHPRNPIYRNETPVEGRST